MSQVNVNQQPLSGWTDLGVYPFNAGSSGYVYLGDMTGQAGFSSQVGYDAVEFVLNGDPCGSYSPPPPPPPPPPTATPTTAPAPPPKVVVLVHGWDFNSGNTACNMDGNGQIGRYVSDSGFKVECFWYRTREGVPEAAWNLRAKIEEWKRNDHVSKVDIVAHSEGGLVSRWYVEKLNGRGNVRNLVMLGTPNRGTPLADAACAWSLVVHPVDWGACDMLHQSNNGRGWVGGSWVLQELNNRPGSRAGVQYRVIAGTASRNRVLGTPNDCVVERTSAIGLNFATESRYVSHAGPASLNGVAGVWGCVTNGEVEDAGVQQRVVQILNGASPTALTQSQSVQVNTDPLEPADAPAAGALASLTKDLHQGDTISLPAELPEAETVAEFVFELPAASSDSVSHSLRGPNGAVNPTDTGVTVDDATADDVRHVTYTITDPAAGTWVLEATGDSMPNGPAPVGMKALVNDGTAVSATNDGTRIAQNTPFLITADVVAAGSADPNATVLATVTSTSGLLLNVSLPGDGTGSYSGAVSDPLPCGVYRVHVHAEGFAGGSAYTREADAFEFVVVPGSTLFDPCVADADGDGIVDQSEASAGLSDPLAADTDGDLISDGPNALPGIAAGPDSCPDTADASAADADQDQLGDVCEVTFGTDPANADTDGDGCKDGREIRATTFGPLQGGDRDPLSQWDFFDVPVPALTPSNATGIRNQAIGLNDVLAIMYYVGARSGGTPNANGVSYDTDLNGNGLPDGREYDRTASTTPGKPWRSNAPNGAVSLQDALVALNQVGDNCN